MNIKPSVQISDNAPAMIKIAKNQSIDYVRCFSHSLNLLFNHFIFYQKDISTEIYNLCISIRKYFDYFYFYIKLYRNFNSINLEYIESNFNFNELSINDSIRPPEPNKLRWESYGLAFSYLYYYSEIINFVNDKYHLNIDISVLHDFKLLIEVGCVFQQSFWKKHLKI